MDEIIEENVAKQTAYLLGEQNGFEQGILEKEKEMVINMYRENINIDVISNCSGLTIDEVEKIIDSSKI